MYDNLYNYWWSLFSKFQEPLFINECNCDPIFACRKNFLLIFSVGYKWKTMCRNRICPKFIVYPIKNHENHFFLDAIHYWYISERCISLLIGTCPSFSKRLMSVEKVQQYLVYSCFNENYKLYLNIVDNFDQTEQITVESLDFMVA